MSIDRLRPIALFDGLSDDQLAELLAAGEMRTFRRDEVLFREAQPADYSGGCCWTGPSNWSGMSAMRTPSWAP